MRARNIKPGFFKNEVLCGLPALTRILFEGLWCYADCKGRFEWRPKRIKAEILPYDNCKIESLLMSLHAKTFIYKYTVDAQDYGFIPTFAQHQNPHPHEAVSKIPPPPKEVLQQIQCHDMSVACNVMSETSRADSLIPDSLIPDSLIPDSLIPSSSLPRHSFTRFWEVYPKKKSKGQAEKAWVKIKPDEQLLEKILSTIEQAKTSVEWMKDGGQFIPYPATWLNAKGWEDEYNQTTPFVIAQPGIASFLKRKMKEDGKNDI